MTDKDKEYLDSMDDELFLAYLCMTYGAKLPKWEKCSKEEYEKYMGKTARNEGVITMQDLIRIADQVFVGKSYRAVPIYHNVGLLNQINVKEPDEYRYEKLVGYENVLMMGSEMIDYCKTRECMKGYFNK